MTAAIAERLPATFELAFAAMFVATLIAVTYVAMNLLTDLATACSIRASGSNDVLRTGAAIVILAALAALLGPLVTPFDPSAQDLALRLAGPSGTHPFGLDELGRDILRACSPARASRSSSGSRSSRCRPRSARCSARSPAISAAWPTM